MADSYYRVHELRIIDDTDEQPVVAYIRIGNANDFMPIAGWYRKEVPEGVTSLDFVQMALGNQDYLRWPKCPPPGETQPDPYKGYGG